MFRHNLILALRYIRSKKIYASIILSSLIVGFVCANLMISFLVGEVTADQHHYNADRIYQIQSSDPFEQTKKRLAFVTEEFADYLLHNYPEVGGVCQISDTRNIALSNDKSAFEKMKIVASDAALFTFFDFPGYSPPASFDMSSIVLSQEKAAMLFGSVDAIGKIVSLRSDTVIQLVVAGVYKKSEARSHLNIDAVIHRDLIPSLSKSGSKFQSGGALYVFAQDAETASDLIDKINHDPKRPQLAGSTVDYFIQPLSQSYFNADNRLGFMTTRSTIFINIGYVVCVLVLFIAMFNFINLFLLFWQGRQKDVGIKKTMGISTRGLFAFSFIESGIYVAVAYLISILATYYLIPVFNEVFRATLSTSYFANIRVISSVGLLIFLLIATAVCIAVYKQSQMKPIGLLSRGLSRVTFSKGLFTVQFVVASVMAICSATIIQQMDFVKHGPLGFNRRVIQLEIPGKGNVSLAQALKQKILQMSGIQNVSVSSGNPISDNASVRFPLGNDQFYSPYLFAGDEDLIKTLGLQLLKGKLPTPGSNERLVNEELVKQFELKDPIGEKLPGTEDLIIAGIVKNFTIVSFKKEIPPAIIAIEQRSGKLLIDYRGLADDLLPKLEFIWKSVAADMPFSYRIIQDDLMANYREDTQFYKIIITLSTVCTILSSFGMFALSWAVIQNRTKEIGIRKVLGATPKDILNLLTITFTKRIAIAFLMGMPVAYYLVNQWLSRFVNRIDLNVWIFVMPAMGIIMISFLTLGFQTIKATRTNPVDEIKND